MKQAGCTLAVNGLVGYIFKKIYIYIFTSTSSIFFYC